MRKSFVAGNWKMNTTASETEALITELKSQINGVDVDVAVCPPFPYLATASRAAQGSQIQVGAQNMYFEPKGAFTGEVSGTMLKDTGCAYVILGHSERRHVFGETDDLINKKVQKALQDDLLPILCVGELLEEREAGNTDNVVKTQLNGGLESISSSDMIKITIAYEPVWAIGTGKTATPDQAQKVHAFIRGWLEGKYGKDVADQIRIQYGGSVKPDNARELLSREDIDGALVGGASLQADSFASIVKAGV